MPTLKLILDNLDDVETPYASLYTEKDGKFHLTGIEGMKTQGDIDRLKRSLDQERESHRKLRETIEPFKGYLENPDDILAKLDRLPELEAAAAGKLDETKLNEMVETRLRTRIAPIERKSKTVEDENVSLKQAIANYEMREKQRLIHDAVRSAAIASKMIDTAVDDALTLAERMLTITDDGKVVTKEGVGVTPDSDPTVWLSEIQTKRPHWWPMSQGGGARGSGGGGGGVTNPWKASSWNLTEQGRILREDEARADRMAAAAGTTVGGPKPKG